MANRAVLNLAPHPDDELLGAPATLMALHNAGMRVVNLTCSLGRPGERTQRKAEVKKACRLAHFDKLLIPKGAESLSSRGDAVATRATLKRIIEDAIEDEQPSIVISPSPHDRHRFHEAVARAARDVLTSLGEGAPRWWMWSIWGYLPFPTIATPFDERRLAEIEHALSAHDSQLKRNDYRRFLRGRAQMNSSLGQELLFGFGLDGETNPNVKRIREEPYVELLSEVALVSRSWMLGKPRLLNPEALLDPQSETAFDEWLDAPSETLIDNWLDAPSVTDQYGLPGSQCSEGMQR